MVQGVLTNPAANQFLFSMFENQDSLNDTIQQEVDERRTPVWDTIKDKLELLIEGKKQDQEVANKNSENLLEEVKVLLHKSTNSVTNKLKLVQTSVENTIRALKNKLIFENTDMQSKMISNFHQTKEYIKETTKAMQISINNKLDLVNRGLDSLRKSMESTLSSLKSFLVLPRGNTTVLSLSPVDENLHAMTH